MKTKAIIKCLRTGVPGLDEVLGGGFPEFSFNLIAGAPGSGKTTLAHQIMFSLSTPERPSLYLTVFGEPPVKMLRYQQQFDFFDTDAIGHSIHLINLSDELRGYDLDQVLRRIVAEVEKYNPALVFVDSFRSIVRGSTNKGKSENNLQQFIQELGMLMTSWQATTFLIGEYSDETDANPIFTVADGMICLQQSVQRNSMVRKIKVMKMRGQPSLPGLHTFRIGEAGITVFAPARVQVGPDNRTEEPLTSRALMGVPRLDEMMGGGLPRGYSLLVAGPSGSGKSILASAFLVEGARCRENGVIAAFEQDAKRSRSRHRGIADLIASGRIGVVDSRSPDLSIDEIVGLLLREISRLNAKRVVIDSLSGFEMFLAPTFRADFRQNMARMVAALASVDVTVLMTCELEDRYTDLRFSPYGTAFMTDAIIVQRYMEVDSRLLRMMAVVKVRGSDHSNELREYSIDNDGLRIGETLSDLEGLLGGRPQRPEVSALDNDKSRQDTGRQP